MGERPILFSGPMVLAILEGRKTQTRRLVRIPEDVHADSLRVSSWGRQAALLGDDKDLVPYLLGPRIEGQYLLASLRGDVGYKRITCPYGFHRDRLWVREAWQLVLPSRDWETGYVDDVTVWSGELPPCLPKDDRNWQAWYLAGSGDDGMAPDDRIVRRWRSPIHMPRWASRLTLQISEVRAQRLQDISEGDAEAEGAEPLLVPPDGGSAPHAEGFRELWDSINGKRPGASWEANPWVWALTFHRVEGLRQEGAFDATGRVAKGGG